MSTLIIYAHPYEKSFNHHILKTIIEKNLNKVDIINLYEDNFNLIYSKEELALFKDGDTNNSVIKNYQNRISKASNIVFIFPIWWNDIPGIVKSFVDLVMKKKFAYIDTPTGVSGKLTNIKSVSVITTSNSPTWYIKLFCGNSINKVFLNATCKQLGIKKRRWINLGNIKKTSSLNKKKFLNKINKQI